MALMRLCCASGASLDIYDQAAGKVAVELLLSAPTANTMVKISLFDLLPPATEVVGFSTQPAACTQIREMQTLALEERCNFIQEQVTAMKNDTQDLLRTTKQMQIDSEFKTSTAPTGSNSNEAPEAVSNDYIEKRMKDYEYEVQQLMVQTHSMAELEVKLAHLAGMTGDFAGKIQNLEAKLEEFSANFNRIDKRFEKNKETEASLVKTAETHDLWLKTFIANCETRIKEVESSFANDSMGNKLLWKELAKLQDSLATFRGMQTMTMQNELAEFSEHFAASQESTLEMMQKLTQKHVTDLYAESVHAMKAIIYKAFSSVDDRVLKLESRAGELEQLGEYGESIINRMNLIENRFNLSRIPVNDLHNDVLNSDNLMQACVPNSELKCNDLMQAHDEPNCDYLMHACVPQPPSAEDRDLLLQVPCVSAVSTVNSQLICASHQMHFPSSDKDLHNSSHNSSESDMRIQELPCTNAEQLDNANADVATSYKANAVVATNCNSHAEHTD